MLINYLLDDWGCIESLALALLVRSAGALGLPEAEEPNLRHHAATLARQLERVPLVGAAADRHRGNCLEPNVQRRATELL